MLGLLDDAFVFGSLPRSASLSLSARVYFGLDGRWRGSRCKGQENARYLWGSLSPNLPSPCYISKTLSFCFCAFQRYVGWSRYTLWQITKWLGGRESLGRTAKNNRTYDVQDDLDLDDDWRDRGSETVVKGGREAADTSQHRNLILTNVSVFTCACACFKGKCGVNL
jgi:hypothetical protein